MTISHEHFQRVPDRIVNWYIDKANAEPYPEEVDRIYESEILRRYPWAVEWAFDLEVLKGNKPNNRFEAPYSRPLFVRHASELNLEYRDYFDVVTWDPNSPTEGLLLTAYDLDRLKLEDISVEGIKVPTIVRFGPDRKKQALAERAWYLGHWNSRERGEYLYRLEQELGEQREGDATTQYPVRTHAAYDQFKPPLDPHRLIDPNIGLVWIGNPAFADFNYLKLFDPNNNSRNKILDQGIFARLGKHIRSCIDLGPMYDANSVDSIATAAMSHSLSTISRNGIYADDDRQFALAKAVVEKLRRTKAPEHEYGEFLKQKWVDNVAVALPVDDPDRVVDIARRYIEELGIKSFKLFTISSNTKIVETCRALRTAFGEEIEIFAGQIADKTEALQLIADDINVDALCLGHGGGRQCTSAIGGMAVATIQLLDNLRSDERFQNTTIMVEGGVGEMPGVALLMGADGVYYFQRETGAVIEGAAGDCLVIEKATNNYGIPYRGEASLPTSVIEAALSDYLLAKHFSPAGRSKQTEGKWGFTYSHRKSASMTYNHYILERLVAKMLADIGARSIGEMRKKLTKLDFEVLTHLTSETNAISHAYGNSR